MKPTEVVEGLVIGIFAACVILYGFQTSVLYPDVVLHAFHHPWLIILMLCIGIYMYQWNEIISVFMILLILALCLDYMIFSRPISNLLNESPAEKLSHMSAEDAQPYNEAIVTKIPGVGVSVVDNGVALSSISLSQPIYPINEQPVLESGNYAPFRMDPL